jgi:hypothetical protein
MDKLRFNSRLWPYFCLLQNVQTNCGAHPASYSMLTTVLSQGVNQLGREVDHLLPSSADVKNEWSYTSTPLICFCHVNRDVIVSLRVMICSDMAEI